MGGGGQRGGVQGLLQGRRTPCALGCRTFLGRLGAGGGGRGAVLVPSPALGGPGEEALESGLGGERTGTRRRRWPRSRTRTACSWLCPTSASAFRQAP